MTLGAALAFSAAARMIVCQFAWLQCLTENARMGRSGYERRSHIEAHSREIVESRHGSTLVTAEASDFAATVHKEGFVEFPRNEHG